MVNFIHLEEICKKVNSIAPSLAKLIEAGFDKKNAENIRKMYCLYPPENKDETDLVKSFLSCGNISNFDAFGIAFYSSERDIGNNARAFGFMDVDQIIENRNDLGIYLIDEFGETLPIPIAPSFSTFLELLPILKKYDKIGYIGETYSAEVKNQTKEALFLLLKEPKFFTFFEMSLS